MAIVKLQCDCGTVKGSLKLVPSQFFHIECMCCDCQAYARTLKVEHSLLTDYGATELLQTYPDYLKLSQGIDQVACVRLTDKGLYRWYARCCHSPLANTLGSPNVPFVGLIVDRLKLSDSEKRSMLGPVVLKAYAKDAITEKPEGAHDSFPPSAMFKTLLFMLKGVIKRRHKPSPFFQQGEPICAPQVLTRKAR
jgi:hypothetical protein